MVAAVVAGCGAGAGLAAGQPRLSVRDQVPQPLRELAETSPLAGYRAYAKQLRDKTLLRADGLPAGQRLRMAVMDQYDGVAWRLSEASNRFGPCATATGPASGAGEQVDLRADPVTRPWRFALETDPVLVPDPQAPSPDALRCSKPTNTVAAPADGTGSLAYSLVAVPAGRPDRPQIEAATAATPVPPDAIDLPPAVALKAAELTLGRPTAGAKALAIEAGLRDAGYFSHGQAGQAALAPAGHGADRMAGLLGGPAMVGDAEQYASAMALIGRAAGLDTRVVMGFPAGSGRADGTGAREFTGADLSAWVEVALDGLGWVAFDPTPNPSRTPDQAQAKARRRDDQAQLQPPEPPKAAEPPAEPAKAAVKASSPVPPEQHAGWRPWLALGAAPAAPAMAVLLRRRHRRLQASRQPAAAILAEWDRLARRLGRLGLAAPPGATRRELAATLPPRLAPAAQALAAGADAAAFGARTASAAKARRFQAKAAALAKAAQAGAKPWRRWTAKVTWCPGRCARGGRCRPTRARPSVRRPSRSRTRRSFQPGGPGGSTSGTRPPPVAAASG
jgi:transglutaminase-like putative cysteine protease